MNPTVKNIVAVVAGFVVGSIVNFGLILVGMTLVPLPEGTDVSTMAAVRESMKSLEPVHFVFPFLGHAVGTLVGAATAAKLAASRPGSLAGIIGVIFLLGGIAMVLNCGGPAWFIAADLLLAYIPMAWLGGRIGAKKRAERP